MDKPATDVDLDITEVLALLMDKLPKNALLEGLSIATAYGAHKLVIEIAFMDIDGRLRKGIAELIGNAMKPAKNGS